MARPYENKTHGILVRHMVALPAPWARGQKTFTTTSLQRDRDLFSSSKIGAHYPVLGLLLGKLGNDRSVFPDGIPAVCLAKSQSRVVHEKPGKPLQLLVALLQMRLTPKLAFGLCPKA